ncbi:MAG: RHS repeat-associated core domain-containing protein, partial [Cytophagales bacterium]|nr:RHS repeat-associated core domain-containing protein [Cytophagales bacterium]
TMTDENQIIVWQADYKPFGEVTITTSTIDNNLRFPGQYYDAETGLYYNYFRYYDPNTGRYITSDPIGLRGGINTFAYVGGNPVMYIDPEGLWAKSALVVIAVVEGVRAAAAWPDVKNWRDEANNKFTSDKDKHAWISEQIAREHGADISAIYGIGKEVFDLTPWGGNPEWADLEADFDGIKKACGF